MLRTGWVLGCALALAACGGGQKPAGSGSAAVPAGGDPRTPAAAPSVGAGPSASESTAPALPPPRPGPIVMRCDDVSAPPPPPSASPPASSSAAAPASAPKPPPRAGATSRALPWRRLTPPVTVGFSYIRELAAMGQTLVATGPGIHVSVDGGATFTDASDAVPKDRWGGNESVYDVRRVGDELIAVAKGALLRSVEHGKRWLRCSDPPPDGDPKRSVSDLRRAASFGGVAYVAIGSRLFVSTDAGRTWFQAPGSIPMPFSDTLLATEHGLYAHSSGNIGSLHRSTDHGATWKYILPALKMEEGEGPVAIAEIGGKLYASTTRGGLHSSTDGGETWTRRWLGSGPDYQAPTPSRMWSVGGELVAEVGLRLHRLGKDGKFVQVEERKPLAVAVDGRNVYALNAEYLARSADGGRTFQDARVQGLADDAVRKVVASGKNIGMVASGPSTYFSFDGGATFQRGPEASENSEVAAVADGIYFSTTRGDRGVLLLQPAAGGPARELGSGRDFGKIRPMILAAEGKALLVYTWGVGKLLISRDAGDTFVEAPKLEMAPPDRTPGLVRGDELVVAPHGNIYRSRGGAPFESLWKSTGPKNRPPNAIALTEDGPVIHVVTGDDIVDWDPKTDQMTSLGKKIPRDEKQREYIGLAAVRGKTILAQVRGNKRVQLYLSRDRGASYQEVDGPPGYTVGSLALSDAGILAAGKGLWLLPVAP